MENKSSSKNFFTSTMGKIVITAVLMLIIYGAIILISTSSLPILIIPLGLALLVFGWKTIGPTNPFLVIFASGNFLIFYYIFKVFIAFFIGYFVAPFKLSKIIVNAISSKSR